MFKFLKYFVLLSSVILAAAPMEPLTNYNVIMVHGAADSGEGIKSNLCTDIEETSSPYAHYGNVYDAATMMGPYEDEGDDYNLTYWLDSAILENVSF